MARRKSGSRSQIIPTLILLVIFSIVGIVCIIRNNQEAARQREEAAQKRQEAAQQQEIEANAAAAYHDSMAALDSKSFICAADACKAVGLMIPYRGAQGTYSREYIPEEYVAEAPEEVRYLVRFIYDKVSAGTYGIAGAYRHKYEVKIIDLSTGKTVAENVFLGSDPPDSIQAGDGDQFGDYPDVDTVAEWIRSTCDEYDKSSSSEEA